LWTQRTPRSNSVGKSCSNQWEVTSTSPAASSSSESPDPMVRTSTSGKASAISPLMR